jgi:regulator of protease activity HflC (stomatin/prohibitin superfamily)
MILADTGMNPAVVAVVAIVAILLVVAIANVKIVPQGNATVIEWLGRYQTTWGTGMHWKVPFFQRIAKNIVLMEQVADFPPQPVITKDNVKMQIDAVVFYQITDCKLYAYGHANPMAAIENLTATTLRNLIGELELDATLTSRDVVNVKMRAILDEATDPWGIKVTRVELKNIMPPREIQDAMEKQMKAERERRESILKAEGEKKSAILIAEGQKESKILAAQAEKEAKILAAEAEKQAKIAAAEGEAEAILKVQTATAEGIRMINESAPTQQVLAIKSLEAMEKVADGKATKIIIPSNLQGLAGLTTTASELFKAE